MVYVLNVGQHMVYTIQVIRDLVNISQLIQFIIHNT